MVTWRVLEIIGQCSQFAPRLTNKTNNMSNNFTENVSALTETKFYTDGTISSRCTHELPDFFEVGQYVKVMHGQMTVNREGETSFRPQRQNNAMHHPVLHNSHHGTLKSYPKSFVLSLKYDKNKSASELITGLTEDFAEMISWLIEKTITNSNESSTHEA